jgi:hypothetical protein
MYKSKFRALLWVCGTVFTTVTPPIAQLLMPFESKLPVQESFEELMQ